MNLIHFLLFIILCCIILVFSCNWRYYRFQNYHNCVTESMDNGKNSKEADLDCGLHLM
jgi:hypothetical protein